MTPVPSSNIKITAENVKDLQEIARYYGNNIDYIAKLTKDNRFLFIADGGGVDKYDYPSMTKLAHVAIPVTTYYFQDFKYNTESYFQNTNDGNWVLIDNRWLVSLNDNQNPKIRDLLTEFPLKPLHIRTSALAPNGSLLMISDRRCTDTCKWDIAKIINPSDDSEKDIPSLYGFLTAISPDGQYIAFSNELSINIWGTSDFKLINMIKLDYPYSLTNIAFSEDGKLLAVSQKSNIKVYNVGTGDNQVSVQGLCETYKRRVIFAPNLPVRAVESSDCDSGVWLIDQGRATGGTSANYDLSKIKFDEDGRISSIPYPYPASDLSAYGRQYYFQFLDNGTLVFKNDEEHGYSCTISLSNNSIKCSTGTQKYVDGQYLGSGQVLGTDGQFYRYEVNHSDVEIRPQNSGKIYYSIPWKGYIFNLEALDPVNNLIFYQVAINSQINKEIIQDMATNKVLKKEEGETFFAPIAFSENKKYAAICQKISYSYGRPIDKLMIFDLTKKAVVYSTAFTCSTIGGDITLSNDGSKLAAQYMQKVFLLDISNSFRRQKIDIETNGGLTAFSPDGNMLIVMCQENTICFLNASDGQEIYRLRAQPGITHIAFSKDGTLMATSSNWGSLSLWAVPPFINK